MLFRSVNTAGDGFYKTRHQKYVNGKGEYNGQNNQTGYIQHSQLLAKKNQRKHYNLKGEENPQNKPVIGKLKKSFSLIPAEKISQKRLNRQNYRHADQCDGQGQLQCGPKPLSLHYMKNVIHTPHSRWGHKKPAFIRWPLKHADDEQIKGEQYHSRHR